VPRTTIIEMAPEEQAHILAALRRVRYGYILALQILLLCAAQRSVTEIAALLFCSRSTVYRVVKAYRAGQVRGRPAGELVGGVGGRTGRAGVPPPADGTRARAHALSHGKRASSPV
jgi:Homeodomain-like domain